MKDKVLITGGAGYIGAVLVPLLLEEGYQVRVLDKFDHPSVSLAGWVGMENLEVVRGDCRDSDTLLECLDGVDYVIPLAAIVGAPACERDKYGAKSINQEAIFTLVSLLKRDQRLLYPNTNSGYGTTKPGEVCTEETPFKPISTYAQTKAEGEHAVLQHENSVSFRLATAFGASARMRLDLLVNDFTHRAIHDRFVVLYQAHFRRNYLHVFDIARLFLFGIKNFPKLMKKGRVFNAGIPQFLTKRELCLAIHKQVPEFQFWEAETGEDPDKRDYHVSVERLTQAGFKCSVFLDQGIRELVKLYHMLPTRSFANA